MPPVEFPTIVYRTPGEHRGPNASSYDWLGAADQEAFDNLIGKGWHATMDGALGREEADDAIFAVDVLHSATDDISVEGRAALEEQAKALEIGFNSRTTDQVLADRIAAVKGSIVEDRT